MNNKENMLCSSFAVLSLDEPSLSYQNYNSAGSDSKKHNYSNGSIKYDHSDLSMYAETDLDQPTDYSLRYAEDDAASEICDKIPSDTRNEFVQDTLKTYCTEGTPYETPFFSNATSMSDLRVDPALENENTFAENAFVDDDKGASYQDKQTRYKEEKNKRYNVEAIRYNDEPIRYTDEPTRYNKEAVRYSNESARYSDEAAGYSDNSARFNDSKRYNSEKSTSRFDEDIVSPKTPDKEIKTSNFTEPEKSPKSNKVKSEFSSGLMSPEKPVNYCEEGTPGYFSRVSSFGSLNEMIKEAEEESNKLCNNDEAASSSVLKPLNKEINTTSENKLVRNEKPAPCTAEETPLMFSRSSSLASLNSVEQHSIHDDQSSDISDISRLTSGIISPSELPDSPTQSISPSPRLPKTPNDYQKKTSAFSHYRRFQSTPRNINKAAFEDNSKSVFHDNVKSIFHDNVKSVFHDNVKSVFHDNVKTVFHDNVKTVFHDNVKTVFHDNVKTVFDDNVKTVFHDNVKSVFHDGVKNVFHDNMKSVFHDNVNSVFHDNLKNVFEDDIDNSRKDVFDDNIKSVFEDNITRFKEESTPLQFSTATSLSSLTIDDHFESGIEEGAVCASEPSSSKKLYGSRINKSYEKDDLHPPDSSLNDESEISETEDEEEILANCIKIGMQSSRNCQSSSKNFLLMHEVPYRSKNVSEELNLTHSDNDSSNLSDDDENILAKCIQSGMPKPKRSNRR